MEGEAAAAGRAKQERGGEAREGGEGGGVELSGAKRQRLLSDSLPSGQDSTHGMEWPASHLAGAAGAVQLTSMPLILGSEGREGGPSPLPSSLPSPHHSREPSGEAEGWAPGMIAMPTTAAMEAPPRPSAAQLMAQGYQQAAVAAGLAVPRGELLAMPRGDLERRQAYVNHMIRCSLQSGEMKIDPLTRKVVPNDIFVQSIQADGTLPEFAVKKHSRFRGVTRHKRSGKWESHIWVKDLGRQMYLGAYDLEHHAAEAYDLAMLKIKGPEEARTNFPAEKYGAFMQTIQQMTLEELTAVVKKKGASGGSGRRREAPRTRVPSQYRGVAFNAGLQKWEAKYFEFLKEPAEPAEARGGEEASGVASQSTNNSPTLSPIKEAIAGVSPQQSSPPQPRGRKGSVGSSKEMRAEGGRGKGRAATKCAVSLGFFDDEKDAAVAFDRALVRRRGRRAVINFSHEDYTEEMLMYHQDQLEKLNQPQS